MNENLLLVLLCSGIFPSILSYTLVAPLLPGELIRRNLDQVYAGIILGFYTVVSIFMSPLLPLYLYPRFGYMKVFSAALTTTGCSILLFGVCSYIPNNTLFILSDILIRIFQGIGMAFTFQTSFTAASIVFKKRFASVVALSAIASTGGVAAGPPLGGLLYEFFGYSGPFFILGTCVLIYGAVVTPCLGFQFEPMMEAGEEQEEHSQGMITYKDFLKNGRVLVSLVGAFVGIFIAIFYEPVLGGKLELEYGFDSDQVAYFYSIFTVATFASNLYLTIFPLKRNLLKWITVSSLVSALSLFLMGPSRLLRLPDNLVVMGVGTGLLGMICQVYGVAMVVITLEPLYALFPDQNHRISKLFGAYRQVSIGFGFFFSPFYASTVTSLTSYETTCDSVALLLVVFLAIFLSVQLTHKDKQVVDKSLKEPLLVEDFQIENH